MTIPILVAVLVAVVVPLVVFYFSAAIASVLPRWIGMTAGGIAALAGVAGLWLFFWPEGWGFEGNPLYAFTFVGIPVAIGCFVGSRWATKQEQLRTQSSADLK